MRTRVSSGSPYEPIIGFSRAIRFDNQIFVAGTAPMDAEGNTVGIGDPEAQARQCLETVVKAIKKLGGSANDVVRTRTYLTRPEDWEVVGKVHGEYFRLAKPASTFIVVKGFVNPEWLVEFEAHAIVEE